MKIFAVLLVSSVALCLAASDKKVEKNADKNVQKRGLLGLGEYGHYAPLHHATPLQHAGPALLHDAAHFVPSQQLFSTNGFVPSEPIHELAHHQLPISEARALPALPLAHAALPLTHGPALQYAPQYAPQALETLPAAHLTAHGLAAPLAAPLAAHGLATPLAAQALPLAHAVHAEAHQQIIPTHYNTILKKVGVPYERRVPIDNPIYIQVERQVPIDNPVPVVKYVKQPYPVHVDEPVHIPVVKEIQVPRPYIQRVYQQVAPLAAPAFAAPLATPFEPALFHQPAHFHQAAHFQPAY